MKSYSDVNQWQVAKISSPPSTIFRRHVFRHTGSFTFEEEEALRLQHHASVHQGSYERVDLSLLVERQYFSSVHLYRVYIEKLSAGAVRGGERGEFRTHHREQADGEGNVVTSG